MLSYVKRHKGRAAAMLGLACLWVMWMVGPASAAITLDGTETPAEVFQAVVDENKAAMFILLGAVFTFTILVVLIKKGLNKGKQAAERI